MDVWFDSGTSHAAVLEKREELHSPADLYLEGSDQHRGWFQSSLLTSIGTRERAPYHGVLTHGYVVDGKGKKMSKSVGNVVAPQEVIDQYGAEVLRLWVSSENYQDDVKVSDEILKQVSDAYRKIRNTIRFLLSNINDYEPNVHQVAPEHYTELDKWALAKFAALTDRVTLAYERYEFHTVYHSIFNFCGTVISSIYMDVLKDRLYCSAPDAAERRAAQAVISRILDGLLRLMAPVLCFTADEAWANYHSLPQNGALEATISFSEFPNVQDIKPDEDMLTRWDTLLELRSAVTRVLEGARREKIIGLSLDAEVVLQADAELSSFLGKHQQQLKELCIVSSLRLVEDGKEEAGLQFVADENISGLQIAVQPAAGEKCERCWIVSTTVGSDAEHPTICTRCADVVRSLA